MRNQLYQLSETDIAFPNPEYALTSPDGLLAIVMPIKWVFSHGLAKVSPLCGGRQVNAAL